MKKWDAIHEGSWRTRLADSGIAGDVAR